MPENSDDDDLDWTGAPVFATEPQFDANSSSKCAQDIPNSHIGLCDFQGVCFISMNKMSMFYVLSLDYQFSVMMNSSYILCLYMSSCSSCNDLITKIFLCRIKQTILILFRK